MTGPPGVGGMPPQMRQMMINQYRTMGLKITAEELGLVNGG
jgi:hypothetical protein